MKIQRCTPRQALQSTALKRAFLANGGWFVAGWVVGLLTAFFYQWRPNAVDERKVVHYPHDGAVAADKTVPTFDFYTLLPAANDLLSRMTAVHNTIASPPAQRTDSPANKPWRYLLQVGSFRRIQDAKRLEEQLEHWRLKPTIETVSLHDGERWHRVQLGPFDNKAALQAVQKILAQYNMDSFLLEVK